MYSTIDMVFTLRQLQEKCIEQNQDVALVFVDLAKVFDSVDRAFLWKLLERYGCPPKLPTIIKSFHSGMLGTVSIGGDETEPSPVSHGVKQGCVLAPILFTLLLAATLKEMGEGLSAGVYLTTRPDGKLYDSKPKQRDEKCVKGTRSVCKGTLVCIRLCASSKVHCRSTRNDNKVVKVLYILSCDTMHNDKDNQN